MSIKTVIALIANVFFNYCFLPQIKFYMGFRNLFRRRNDKCQCRTMQHPPSYTPHDANRHIKLASDIPQWRWSNIECRAWLIAVCTTYLSWSMDDALAAAQKFNGFGPDIYLMRIANWEELLGVGNARGVYTLLLQVRDSAVPENIQMGHGWSHGSQKNQPDPA